MKILFAVEDQKEWNSKISARYGRANGFYCYTEENKSFEFIPNDINQKADHGAGVQAGQVAVTAGAKAIVTGGDVGPKAKQVLEAADIAIHSFMGEVSVHDAFFDLFVD